MKNIHGRIIIIAIAIVLMVAFIVAYITFISADSSDEITLPPESSDTNFGDVGLDSEAGFHGISRDNIQQVVAVMSRAESYTRAMSIITNWSGGSSTDYIDICVIDQWTRINITHAGETKCIILSEDNCWIWYAGDKDYITLARGDFSDQAETRIPDYTDILELDENRITDAGLEALDGVMCIYVEFTADGSDQKYWLDLDSGLLNSAQGWENGQMVYEMTQTSIETPLTSENTITGAFTLPDGILLYK